jgi:hypothetical protein
VRIVGDPGGEVSSYVQKFTEIRDSGQRIVVDGPCLSACTLFTGIVPRDRVCITRRAALGFHAASYYNDASRSLVPTRHGSDARPRIKRALSDLSVGVAQKTGWHRNACGAFRRCRQTNSGLSKPGRNDRHA